MKTTFGWTCAKCQTVTLEFGRERPGSCQKQFLNETTCGSTEFQAYRVEVLKLNWTEFNKAKR